MSVRIVEIRESTLPVSSSTRNAYVDLWETTTSLLAVVNGAVQDGHCVGGARLQLRHSPRRERAGQEAEIARRGAAPLPGALENLRPSTEKLGVPLPEALAHSTST